MGGFDLVIEDATVRDPTVAKKYIITGLEAPIWIALTEVDPITHFAFLADVTDQTLLGFRINPWHITGVRITIGIAVLTVKDEDEITARKIGHVGSVGFRR